MVTRINVNASPRFIEWIKQQKADKAERFKKHWDYIANHPEITEELKEMNKNMKKEFTGL